MTLHDALVTIARALPSLHDDAYNPNRAIATPPVDTKVDDRWHDRPGTAHPHLRHPQGATTIPTPAGDRDSLRLYRQACRTITAAYTALVPAARPQGANPTPTPVQLVGQLALIGRSHVDTTGQAAHVTRLFRLADTLEPWANKPRVLPPDEREQCWNPRGRGRCKGYPLVANGLCNSCYQHEYRKKDRLGDRYRLPARPGTVPDHDDWRAEPGRGQVNHMRVSSEPKVILGGNAYAETPAEPPRTTPGVTGGFGTCSGCGSRHEHDQGCAG